MPEVVVTTGAIRCAKLQIVTTNKRTPSCFTGRMPFQQCQSTEGKELTHIINNVFPSKFAMNQKIFPFHYIIRVLQVHQLMYC